MTVLSWQHLLLSLCALGGVSAVSAAATCDLVARSAPNVTTIMAAPNNTARAAWILSPNCSVEIVTLEEDDDNRWKLDCSEKNISRIESLPLDVERLYFDSNAATEGDFTKYPKLVHIILAWCGLTTVEGFHFPSSLQELDFEGNELTGIANGTIPDRVEYLYLGENGLGSIANFSLPSSLSNLFLVADEFESVNFAIPEGLEQLNMDKSKSLKTIDNLVMPSSLTTLSCAGCGVKTFRGVQLSTNLKTLNFTGATLTELEIRDSDVPTLKKVDFVGDVSQTICRDADAKLLKVQARVSACVISDAAFESKYPDRLRSGSGSTSGDSPTTSSSSSSSSSTTIIIIVAVVVGVVCVAVAVLVYRKCARSRADTLASSRHDADNKYHDASTLDVGGSSGGATVRSGSASLFAPQEYLSNDIRNDEALITYRIAYEEVQFLQEIAKGGYGIIYLGRFRGRHVAIKRMLPEKAKDTRIVRSFMDEIRLCASLEHPRIVEFIGISWSTLQDMAVVIEYMGGGDLHTLLRGREAESLPAEWFEASQCLKPKSSLALDIVDGLVYLHSFDHAIIHRDLKARNVLLNDEGDAKLSDFGISREATLDETMTGEIGTVAWIAPEVLRGERYSEKADIYSLGVLLVELDTARHPYRRELSETSGTPQSNTQIALLVSSGKLAPSLTQECPADVAALVASCLSFDPRSRPSAMDVHYELQKILQQHRRG